MDFYFKTDAGIKRRVNQDAVISKTLSSNFAWSLICDGMGGTNGGDIASSVAISEISKSLNADLDETLSSEDIKLFMYKAIENANNKIFEKAFENKLLRDMGTTAVLCIVKGDVMHVMHAGDSRAYLISGDGIKQITKDHSMVQEMVDRGEITMQDARNHPQKNIITRALGVEKNIKLDYIEINLRKGDILLLCSDGLTNEIADNDIYEICLKSDISKIPEKLIREANRAGGRDNITVSVAKI